MATIGRVNVKVTSDTMSFESGMRRMANAFRSVQTGVMSGVGLMGGALATLGVATGIDAFVHKFEDAFNHINEMAKEARALGMTSDQFLGLEYAANLTAVKMQALEAGMRRMMRTIGDATNGTVTAVAAFNQLGLKGEQLAHMNPLEAFKTIADAVNQIPDPAQRIAAMLDIFGKFANSGHRLTSLVSQGSAGIQSMVDEAKGFGIAVDRVDAKKVEQAYASLTRVKGMIQGIVNSLIVEFAPVMERGLNLIIQWGNQFGGFSVIAKTVFREVMFFGLEAFRAIDGMINNTVSNVMDFGYAILEVGKKILSAFKYVTKALGGDPAAVQGFQEMIDGLTNAQTSLGQFAIDSDKDTQAVNQLINAAEDWFNTLDNADAAARGAEQAMDNFDTANIEGAEQVEALIDKLQKQHDEFGLTGVALDLYQMKMAGATQSQIDLGNSLAASITEMENQKKVADELAKLDNEALSAGLNKREQAILQLELMGASMEDLARATRDFDTMDKAQAFEDDMKKAKSLIDDTRTAAEQYEMAIGDLNRLFDEGMIDSDTYDRGVKKAVDDLNKASQRDNSTFQAVNSSLIDVAGLNPQVNLQKEANGYLRNISDKIDAVSTATFG